MSAARAGVSMLAALVLGAAYLVWDGMNDHGEDEPAPDDDTPDAPPDDSIASALSNAPDCVQSLGGPLSVVVGKNRGALGLSDGDLALLLGAISYRETLCGTSPLLVPPRGGASATGDGGHGRGLMQIDDRYHSSFTDTEDWKDPTLNISYALTRVLVPSFKSLGDLQQAVAAYNAGNGPIRKSLSLGEDIDARTTGKNYSAEVLKHARAWGMSA